LSSILGGFDAFQFNARDVSLARDYPMRTRGWVLKMDSNDADERIKKHMEKCHLNGRLTLAPFMDPSSWDTNGATETFFIKQNQMLRNSIREGHPELIVSSCFTITQDRVMRSSIFVL
jgi:hypothetical protein